MCGIAGIYSPKTPIVLRQHALTEMSNAIAHRGPDAEGIWEHQNVGLAHRRLSIIDLSTAANQPFVSDCGRYAIVYNGEVYNYRQLASQYGLQLRTSSDTEVILALFIKLGHDFVRLLNGMFAFAIYDCRTEQIWLFRDRMGIKPLFYTYIAEQSLFGFSSELKSFQQCPLFQPALQISETALHHFLYCGFVPSDQTVYKTVQKLPAGHWARLQDGNLDITPYWKPEQAVLKRPLALTVAAAQNQLSELLVDAVRNCLVSDVPIGVLLSGGIDSSLVAAIAQREMGTQLQTFSIGFDDAQFNELPYARQVAKHLNTQHFDYKISTQEAKDNISAFLNTYDEPFADSSGIPMLSVSALARQQVKVVLSGDGGDELFLGYGSYVWAKRLDNPVVQLLRYPISALFKRMNYRYQRGASMLSYEKAPQRKSHILSQEGYFFTTAEIKRLLLPHNLPADEYSWDETLLPTARSLSPMENQALFDLKNYLKDDLLVKTDRASMRHALEIRLPLLDYRLVELAQNLPLAFKYKQGTAKYLLRKVLFQYLPPELFNRPKRGFAVPMASWLRTDFDYLIHNYLSDAAIEQANWVSVNEVRSLVRQFEAGNDYLFNRIWALIILHKWLLTYRPN